MERLKLNIQLFAEPLLPTGGTHQTQSRFSPIVLKKLRKQNLLRARAGRVYQGSPIAGQVKIPVRDTEVTVGDYDIVTGGALGTSATTYLDVLVNKNKFINELIDGQEAASVPDGLVADRLASGIYSMDRQLELDFIAEITTNGTTEATTTAITTGDAMYQAISASIGEMLKLEVDPSTIVVAVTTDAETLLLDAGTKFTNTASALGAERVMNGGIGMIRGAEVVRCNNLAADEYYVVFSTDYAQADDEWNVPIALNDLKDGVHIGSSALQGRAAYFNKLTRATGARTRTFV